MRTNRLCFRSFPRPRGDPLHDRSDAEQRAARHGQGARRAGRGVGSRDGRAPDAGSRRGGSPVRPTGHLIYAAGETLYAVAFDVDRLEVRGEPVAVVTQDGEFAVSEEGTLVFGSGTNHTRPHVLVWVDREGREEVLGTPVRPYGYPPLVAPDGTRVALDVVGPPDRGYLDVGRGASDARAVYGRSGGESPAGVEPRRAKARVRQRTFRRSANSVLAGLRTAAAAPERLLESDRPTDALQLSRPTAGCSFRPMSRGGAATSTRCRWTAPVASSPFWTVRSQRTGNAEVSPDGRWIAYDSDESRSVRDLRAACPIRDASAGGRWQISSGGGRQPLCGRATGSELFSTATIGGAMLAAPVTPGSYVRSGPERSSYFENDALHRHRHRTLR